MKSRAKQTTNTTDKEHPRDTKRFSQNQVDDIVAEIVQDAQHSRDVLMSVLWHVVELQGGEITLEAINANGDGYVEMSQKDGSVVLKSQRAPEVDNKETPDDVSILP